jgi:enamine deaminase RidA (YjgF/YER057c/UK114 family)
MSDRKLISSGSPFEKANGYSRAVVVGDEIHIAGTTGYDYAKMAMPDDVAEQTRNIYATFTKVMKEAASLPISCACAPSSPTSRIASRLSRCRAKSSARSVRREPSSSSRRS